ncbi:MAG: tetratricopeptide repeat protein, partial [Candidatus Riflebacteria bacterium]|nr:tetratricopeptide repeat protein [Candidatus Riflebacteria bacterium]
DPGFAAGSGPYDIVFCRDLIIYQTADARKSILRTLYGLTAPRGLLFVGHAELTSIMTERWTSVRQPCAFALMKSDGKTGAATGASPPAPPGPSRAQPPAFGAGRRSSGHRPRSGPSPADSGSSAVSPERPTLERASQLADQGRLAEATAVLEEILQHDRQNARAHFLLGIVQEAGGDTRSAEESLNRAIYLDADNVEALRHLVLLAERRGDAAAARRLRGRAERILSRGRGAP